MQYGTTYYIAQGKRGTPHNYIIPITSEVVGSAHSNAIMSAELLSKSLHVVCVRWHSSRLDSRPEQLYGNDVTRKGMMSEDVTLNLETQLQDHHHRI